ncbi:MAG: YqaE/Pmp3 family membrane protein [Desulfobulbaceae bacterium]|nr:MAG: YqaE/Pmp3 family membrane protein [Desulfobulbaceae bacterium]
MFLPPRVVFLTVGLNLHFWVNILLTILGFIPGMIHTVRIIVKKKENQDCFISAEYFNYQHQE